MKKRSLFLLTVVFGLFFLIFACRREIDDIVKTNLNSPPNNLLESAKAWNAEVVKSNFAVNSKIPGFITLEPQWNNSWTLKQKNGSTIIAVPTGIDAPSLRSMTLARLFIFEVNNNTVRGGQIVEFLGLNDYSVNKNLEKLVENYQNTSIEGFSGAIIRYDLNYRWVSGSTYENGDKTNDNVSIVRKSAAENQSSGLTIALYIPFKVLAGKAEASSTNLYKINNRLMSGSGSGSGSGGGTMGGTLSEVTITGSGSSSGGTTQPGYPPPGGNPPPPTTTLPPGTGGGGTNPPVADPTKADKMLCGTNLPPKTGGSPQQQNMCVFKVIEYGRTFLGHPVSADDVAAYYAGMRGVSVESVKAGGVRIEDETALFSHYFDQGSFTALDGISTSINYCKPVMAKIQGNGSTDGHEVFITGYNYDGKTVQIYDPKTATYRLVDASETPGHPSIFLKLTVIIGMPE